MIAGVTALGAGTVLVSASALGARRASADPLHDGPSAIDAEPWLAYERRLRERLSDAGGGRFDADGARAILALTNAARGGAGAGPLAWREDLALTARAHAADLARRGAVEHLSPEGFDPSHRYWLLSRRTIGSPSENIAYVRGRPPATPEHLMQLWRSSPPHWTNLLRKSHTEAGFGLVRLGERAWLVGLYAWPLATLAEPLALKPSEAEVARAMAGLPRALRPEVGPPQGSRLGTGVLQVVQLQAQRRKAEGYELIGGPVFLAAPDSDQRIESFSGA